MSDRLVREFAFTPFGLSMAEDRWTPRDGSTPGGKVTLGVHFLSASADERAACERAASAWLRDGVEHYLAFEMDVSAARAHIRVRFGPGGNWSLIGRHARAERNLSAPTMNIIPGQPDYIIMHEFGHALGLRHEHQHPDAGIQWREDVVIAAMAGNGPAWTPAYIRANVLQPLSNTARCVGDPTPNVNSVMMYDFPEEWTWNRVRGEMGRSITDGDRRCVRGIYSL
ncbi:hypothetical protein GWK16_03225 [Roseomonas sp. JC162]|uniref:Peptidase M12A domain-containing protein n=1 Tax=Neoroseomonas marina TaxID=1232220 RepID=A0A848EAH2_9PROT|nr:M12 family metallopeptidase [Neoroseomonas marina]NMJ40235.1 hypothetical protein [Neoroseomonas marina]